MVSPPSLSAQERTALPALVTLVARKMRLWEVKRVTLANLGAIQAQTVLGIVVEQKAQQ